MKKEHHEVQHLFSDIRIKNKPFTDLHNLDFTTSGYEKGLETLVGDIRRHLR